MDPEAVIQKGRVMDTADLKRRVNFIKITSATITERLLFRQT